MLLWAASLLVASSAEAQRESQARLQPNILVIVLDDLGTDKLSVYGESNSQEYALPPYCGSLDDPLPYPRTPTIDSLAAGNLPGLLGGAIRFDRAYAAPICCPARACLTTGRYGFRNGLGITDDGPKFRRRMNNAEVLLPELLRRGFPAPSSSSSPRKYRCGAFGKWHMSALPVCDPVVASDFGHPIANGFHFFQGAMANLGTAASNPGDHFNWTKVTAQLSGIELTRYEIGGQNSTSPFQFSAACTLPGTTLTRTGFSEEQYSASVTRRDALQWINAQSSPFFAYVSFHAPHFPYQVPPFSLLSQATRDELSNPGNCNGPYCEGQVASTSSTCGTSSCGNSTGCPVTMEHVFYNAMVEAVDTEIGNLLAGMSPAKRANTIVFLMSDNGTPEGVIESQLHDPNHGKGSLYELGVRVPLITAGYLIPRGAHQSNALVHAVDLWRTIADVAGADPNLAAPLQPLDSISFADQLRSPGSPSARTQIFCQGFSLPGGYQPTEAGPYELACQDPSSPGVFQWAPQNVGLHGRSLSDGQYKLIVLQTSSGQDVQPAGTPDILPQYTEELYDILADPEEGTDLMPQLPGNPVLQAIRDQLRAGITLLSGY